MAVTFATATPIRPAKSAKVRAVKIPEASSMTFPRGAPGVVSAGYLTVVTGNLPQTITGFTRLAGQNGASDGAKNGSVYLCTPGTPWQGTLRDTLAATHRGAKALISVNSAGSAFLTIVTASSASYNCKIEGWESNVAIGDTNPVVTFTVLFSKIDQGN